MGSCRSASSHSNITLKHGAIYAYDDLRGIGTYAWVQGQGTRKDGLIVLQGQQRSAEPRWWKFKRMEFQ